MRQLHLVFAQTDKMARVLVAATILPLSSSCGGETADSGLSAAGGSSTQGGAAGTGGSSAQGGVAGTGGSATQGGETSAGGNAATGGTFNCPNGFVQSYTVTLPSSATPVDAATLCNWGGVFPDNLPAARVTLQYDSSTPSHATGTITVASEILAAAGGYVGVSSVTADGATISNLTRVNGNYTFDVNLTSGTPYLGTALTFQVTVDFTCSPAMSSTRQLKAATYVVLCGSARDLNWVSSGDTCTTCNPMVEVAAQLMPAPEREPDGIALPGELNISITPVAREGRTVVLMVQKPSDAPELSLTWWSSGGQLLLAADDVAVWTLPDESGPHQVQVAAEAGQSASIVTYLCRDNA